MIAIETSVAEPSCHRRQPDDVWHCTVRRFASMLPAFIILLYGVFVSVNIRTMEVVGEVHIIVITFRAVAEYAARCRRMSLWFSVLFPMQRRSSLAGNVFTSRSLRQDATAARYDCPRRFITYLLTYLFYCYLYCSYFFQV